MLHPPSSSESMPLFSSSLSSPSSCGMEDRLIIHPPASESISFDWSDFPIILQQDVNIVFPSYEDHFYKADDSSSSSTCTYELSSRSSDSDLSSTSNIRFSSSKRVSFSPGLEIRTHSIVLGDHPCCPSLALELGWEYDETEIVNMDIHEQHKVKCRRRSYIERKHLLRQVSGMTETEIQERSNNMRHSAPSSRHLCDMTGIQL